MNFKKRLLFILLFNLIWMHFTFTQTVNEEKDEAIIREYSLYHSIGLNMFECSEINHLYNINKINYENLYFGYNTIDHDYQKSMDIFYHILEPQLNPYAPFFNQALKTFCVFIARGTKKYLVDPEGNYSKLVTTHPNSEADKGMLF